MSSSCHCTELIDHIQVTAFLLYTHYQGLLSHHLTYIFFPWSLILSLQLPIVFIPPLPESWGGGDNINFPTQKFQNPYMSQSSPSYVGKNIKIIKL